jgi:hypothetical protein
VFPNFPLFNSADPPRIYAIFRPESLTGFLARPDFHDVLFRQLAQRMALSKDMTFFLNRIVPVFLIRRD